MKKETFVEILNTLKKWQDRSEKFCAAVANAYEDAGCEPDFVQPDAYPLLPLKIIDDLVHAIAQDFETPEYAEDHINWWIWECDFGRQVYHNIQTSGILSEVVETPGCVVEINGKKFVCSTPDVLYDAIMFDQSINYKYTL